MVHGSGVLINNLIFQWYRIDTVSQERVWIELTLSIALTKILWGNYSLGYTTNTTWTVGTMFTGIIDNFEQTTIKAHQRGGNDLNYVRPGWILILGY